MSGVALLSAELRQGFRRPRSTRWCSLAEALAAALVAVAAPPVGQRRSALQAGAGQLGELGG
jgi:hypothetical protein